MATHGYMEPPLFSEVRRQIESDTRIDIVFCRALVKHQTVIDNVWVHNLNPFLVRFNSSVGIRWYGLAYLTGFVVGALLMAFIARRGRGTIRPALITEFITYVVLGTMIGGRLGYAIFYAPEMLTDFSAQFPYWRVLRTWEGGMASHGGILGILIAAILFARRYRMDWRHLGDLVVLGGSVGIFFGRLANFMNGELFGRAAPPGFPLAMKFPSEMYLWFREDLERKLSDVGPGSLTKITSAAQAIGISPDTWMRAARSVRVSQEARAMVTSTIERILFAIQSGNEAVRAALGTELTARYPSQLIEAGLEGLLLFLIAFFTWRRPRRPGVVGAAWFTAYALVRIIAEQFRMPDAQIGYQLFGLTRGQWLSIGMLAVSGLLWWLVLRKPSPLIGGWGAEAVRLRHEHPLPYQGESTPPEEGPSTHP